MAIYQHSWQGGEACDLPLGKVVCVGRNYAAHARELNNPVPTEPILFIKPATACVAMAEPLNFPRDRGSCHFETELALLIGERLSSASTEAALAAVVGVGLAFDLTLRDEQQVLKEKGLPWEKAKAFDAACPLSAFVSADHIQDWADIGVRLEVNGELRQAGTSADMLTAIPELLAYMSRHFTLLPGDVILTGTPAGVGPLEAGDCLSVELYGPQQKQLLQVETRVMADTD